MKTIETRSGCYDAVRCGDTCRDCGAYRFYHDPRSSQYVGHFYVPRGRHVCGSPDACSVVKPSGEVCTTGAMTSVPMYEAADVERGRSFLADQITGLGHRIEPALNALMIGMTKRELGGPGNEHTPENEQAQREYGKRHGDSVRAHHAANPSVFGHN